MGADISVDVRVYARLANEKSDAAAKKGPRQARLRATRKSGAGEKLHNLST